MKKQNGRIAIKCISLFLLIVSFSSCNTKSEDSKITAENNNNVKSSGSKEKDAQFLVNAASINLEEIKLSQLSESRAMEADVKSLTKMILDDHTKSMNELKTLAAKKIVTLPSSLSDESQNEYDKLMEKSGNNFDKKYCELMVNGHKNAIKEFETASNEANDPDIRDWASKTLPVLRGHLDHAMTCSENYK